jgi:hypothetical protein
MKSKFFFSSIVALLVSLSFGLLSAYAYTDGEGGGGTPGSFNGVWFNTEDGRPETSVTTTSAQSTVRVQVQLYNNVNFSSVQVRLRNKATNGVTTYKGFSSYGIVYFTSMRAGTYYVDIRDFVSGPVYGSVLATRQ